MRIEPHVSSGFLDRRAFLRASLGAAAPLFMPGGSSWATSQSRDDLTHLTLHEAAERVRRLDASPVELTEACLARIGRYDSRVNSFITVTSQLALQQAEAAGKEIRDGRWRGPLHGIPIALKDYIDTAGVMTTGGSVFVDRVPTQDAEVVARLKRAGAVLIGKLNCGSVLTSHGGAVRNPWALDRECGYTSSGSAAAVAADFCFGALGTDQGGSVRLPAAACGVVGLKPTHGIVSNHGVIADRGSMDHVGPLGKTVLDTAILLRSIAGYDPKWAGSLNIDLPDYVAALDDNRTRLRIGVPRKGFFENLDTAVADAIEAALKTISSLGTVNSVACPGLEAVPRHLEILEDLKAEHLAYYASILESAPEQFHPNFHKYLQGELRKCVSGIRYVKAVHAVQEARRRVAEICTDEIDLLVMPTSKRLPMTIDEFQRSWRPSKEQILHDVWNTLPFNVLGLPAISITCGYTREGLPVGLQIVGRPFGEAQVLAFAHAYEQATPWHLRKPNL